MVIAKDPSMFVHMAAMTIILCISTVVCQENAPKQPHILMILADDYGWHDIGYHSTDLETPVLDRLASEGVKLENYYVQPMCSPSRSQLLSGRYQIHTGLQHNEIHSAQANGLPLGIPTIADKLRAAGYATHMVGKWHLGFYKKEYTPLYRGFDSFFGFYTGSEDYFTHRHCEKMKNYGQACGLDMWDGEEPVWNNTEYTAHLFARKSQEIIANHNSSKPLFLYLALESVHGPRQVPEKYKENYDWIIYEKRRTYAGMVAVMDEAVGNVTSAFKEHGLWDDTVMVFSTDNGGHHESGANNWPLRGERGSLWEGAIRGIGFVRGLLESTQGTLSNQLVHISDWFPTFMHLANASTDGLKLDGNNVWDTISRNQPSPRTELLHNIDPLGIKKGNNLYPHIFDVRIRSALRNGDWKILTGYPGKDYWHALPNDTEMHMDYVFEGDPLKNIWLFNITDDPYERLEVSSEYPDVVEFLLKRLAYHDGTSVKVRYPSPDPKSNPETKQQGGLWRPWRGIMLSNRTAHRVHMPGQMGANFGPHQQHHLHVSTIIMEAAAVVVAIGIIVWFSLRCRRRVHKERIRKISENQEVLIE